MNPLRTVLQTAGFPIAYWVMVPPEGFEPSPECLKGTRSAQLSYGGMVRAGRIELHLLDVTQAFYR
ncbi:hypothetical protein LCGC14_2229080 [marine sediment metagenome]|uniref:Uncharacterized protein n=1 Tax=marine sediment metagenome TaxID=412755 RepID=A0A0F9D8Q5_9ZZZZ